MMSLSVVPLAMALSHDAFQLAPSMPRTTGMHQRTERMLTTPYWLAAPMALTQGCFITVLPITPLSAADWLAIMAEITASQLNESSLSEANATPPMMGMRHAYTCQAWTLPVRRTSFTAEKAGSQALRIWPKDTAPAPRATTEPPWAPAAQRPMGAISFQLSMVISGFFLRPTSQRGMTQRAPTMSCAVATLQTRPPLAPPTRLSAFLL
mmetsp:Transcript_41900/g.102743  ORF Transcript_41900/g.102743 Transcript_41900/m.102743 type:complete len:209 (-) Transcript_41900:322-948(-)